MAAIPLLRVFISYSHEDNTLAGQIRKELMKYGMRVFLAHNNIEPSDEWAKEIIKHLEHCHIFIPLLTKNFDNSKWTDQESGIAFHLEKMIIPLKVDSDPHGFISRFQALLLDEDDVPGGISKVIRKIAKTKGFRLPFRRGLIKRYAASTSFVVAGVRTKRLVSYTGYSDRQLEAIAKAAIGNDQIHGCSKCRKMLRDFFSDYKDDIEPKLHRRLRQYI